MLYKVLRHNRKISEFMINETKEFNIGLKQYKTMKNILSLLAFFIYSFSSLAQTNEWIYFSSNKLINSVFVHGNNLWIGTDVGPIYMNKETGEKIHFYSCNCLIPTNNINDIQVDNNGIVWFVTNWGLTKFDGINWTTYNSSNSGLPTNFLLSIAMDSDGILWIGSYWGQIIRYDGNSWQTLTGPNSDAIWDIFVDSDGKKWISANSSGLWVLDNNNHFTIYNSSNSGLPSDWVFNVSADGFGNKWICTLGGLVKFDNVTWTVYNSINSGLPFDWVRCVSIDASGNKWIGTWSGLAKFDDVNWTVLS